MKRKSVFRIVLATLLVILLGQSAFQLNLKAHETYLELGNKLLGSVEAAEAQLLKQQLQMMLNIFLEMLIDALFHGLVLKRLNERRLWWLSFPATLAVAAIFALGLSHLDLWLNPFYFLYFELGIDPLGPSDSFLRLQGYNFVNIFHACLFAGLIFKVEESLFDNFSSLKKRLLYVGSSFWLTLFFTSFLGTYGVFYMVVPSIDQFINVIPQVTIMSVCATLVGVFFLDHYLKDGKIQMSRPWNEHAKFLFSSLGFLGGSLLIFTWKWGMSLDLLFLMRLSVSLLAIMSTCLITYLLYLGNVGNIRKGHGLQAALEKKTSELDFLKSQINPHFLFNSLNTVYGIALTENSPKTAGSVQMLSEMMRFMLKENTKEFIPLSREISYIQNYIDLQALRLTGSKTRLEVDLNTSCEGQIAPMMLIPFIENAFKHGVSNQKASSIEIKLDCEPGSVHLWVKNARHQRALPKSEESGIGLNNVKERLNILYAGKHLLDLSEEDDTFEVRLKLSLS